MLKIEGENRSCAACKFSSGERLRPPNVLQYVLLCKYGPPTPVLIPTGPNAASVQPIWPVVAPSHWCHRYETYLQGSTLPKDD